MSPSFWHYHRNIKINVTDNRHLASRACAKCVWRVTVSTVQPQESYPEEGREGERPPQNSHLAFVYLLGQLDYSLYGQRNENRLYISL